MNKTVTFGPNAARCSSRCTQSHSVSCPTANDRRKTAEHDAPWNKTSKDIDRYSIDPSSRFLLRDVCETVAIQAKEVEQMKAQTTKKPTKKTPKSPKSGCNR